MPCNFRNLQHYLLTKSIHSIMKVTNKMQLYRLIYCSQSALHVSGDVFAHHQEHLTVFTVSGSIHCNNKFVITSTVLCRCQ